MPSLGRHHSDYDRYNWIVFLAQQGRNRRGQHFTLMGLSSSRTAERRKRTDTFALKIHLTNRRKEAGKEYLNTFPT